MPTEEGWFNLSPEQSKRVASAAGLKIEGFIPTLETRAFFASRGLNLDNLTLDDGTNESTSSPKQAPHPRRPHYNPLAPTGQIRFLSILPGTKDDPLRCELHHHTLQSPHSYNPHLGAYEALSYTWNAPLRTRHYTTAPADAGEEFTAEAYMASALGGGAYTLTDETLPTNYPPQSDQVDEKDLMRLEEITIDGEPCDLSVNLALLFQHLRKPNGVRKLWVDALCIDQANLAERGAQVAQMDRIYAHASTVHVWLGPHADGSNDSIVLAEFLWRCAFVERISPTELFTSGDEAANMATLAALEKLTILLERPWWTRRWVVQEVALAREVLVHCGRKTVEWRKLAYAVRYLREKRLELRYLRVRNLYLRADPRAYRRGYLKPAAAETLVGITENVIRRLPSPCTHPVFERRADLEGLLGQLRTLQCTNPLDTVYALLSIASDAETWGIGAPDYDRSVVEVYMEVVLRIVEMKHSLNVFCQQWANSFKLDTALPSWIQSYRPSATRHEGGTDTAQDRRAFVGNGQRSRFRAAGSRTKKGAPGRMTNYEGIGQALMVTGWIVDIVEYVGRGAFKDIPAAWKDIAFGVLPKLSPEHGSKVRLWKEAFSTLSFPIENHGSPYATLADVLTASSTSTHNYTSEVYGPVCEALFAENSPYRKNTGDLNIFEVRGDPTPAALYHPSSSTQFPTELVHEFLNEVAACTFNRQLVRTCNGALALVDALIPAVEPGDVVCVLIGCDVPVVLRPQSKLDFKVTMCHGVFELLGEGYVQGIMHGEALAQVDGLGKERDQRTGGIFLV